MYRSFCPMPWAEALGPAARAATLSNQQKLSNANSDEICVAEIFYSIFVLDNTNQVVQN